MRFSAVDRSALLEFIWSPGGASAKRNVTATSRPAGLIPLGSGAATASFIPRLWRDVAGHLELPASSICWGAFMRTVIVESASPFGGSPFKTGGNPGAG